jgi:hypothetical protein
MERPNPLTEAKALLALARRTGESIDAIRTLIGTHSDYRKQVLACFDRLSARRRPVAEEHKAVIVRLLTQGLTQQKVRDQLDVSLSLIRQLSRRSAAATFRPRQGRNGRRFTETLKRTIHEAAQAGKMPMEIARDLNVSCATTLKYCRAVGYQGRTYRLKWSNELIAECEQALRRGEQWRAVARISGVGIQTLLTRISFRKKGARGY